jgi:hypothetical protein
MLKVLVSTIRDKTCGEWLSLPSSMKERLTVFDKLTPIIFVQQWNSYY